MKRNFLYLMALVLACEAIAAENWSQPERQVTVPQNSAAIAFTAKLKSAAKISGRKGAGPQAKQLDETENSARPRAWDAKFYGWR